MRAKIIKAIDRILGRCGLERTARNPIRELCVTWYSPTTWNDEPNKPTHVDLTLNNGANVTGYVYPELQIGYR